jgi:hypothetical protein
MSKSAPSESEESIYAKKKACLEATPAWTKYTEAIEGNVTALNKHAEMLKTHAKAVDEFQAKWSSLDAQAKALLKGCWDFDHRKWEEEQRHKHTLYQITFLVAGGLIWLGLLWAVIRCLEGAVSDIGKYGAVVLCAFLVISLSVPATLALFIMKRPSDD